jgi:hypothetical protein
MAEADSVGADGVAGAFEAPGCGEMDGLARAGVGLDVGIGVGEAEGVAAPPQPARRASDAKPTMNPGITVCQRIGSRLRDARVPVIVARPGRGAKGTERQQAIACASAVIARGCRPQG